MKNSKILFSSITLFLFCFISFSQNKVPIKEVFTTDLKTFKVEFNDGFYSNNISTGWRYPAIKQDFYTCGFFLRYESLIKLYEELIAISNSEDGEYILETKLNNIRHVKKAGKRLHLETLGYLNNHPYYSYQKRIQTKYLEDDLNLILTVFKNYNNK
jgi:hypothetical protein